MDFSKLTELEKGFRPLCCDKGIGLECCTDKCAADEEQSELTAERAAKAQGALTDEIAAFEASVLSRNVGYDNPRMLLELNAAGKYAVVRIQGEWEGWQARAALAPSIQALPVVAEPTSPAILEAMSWHARERDDLTLEDAVKAFRFGYSEVRQRDDRAMLAQIIHLLAEAPAAAQPEAKEAPAALSDAQIESLWQALPGIEIHNKAAKSGMDTGYAIRIAHARAVLAAAGNSQDAKDAERLDFVLHRGAFILTVPKGRKSGDVAGYQLLEQDEDEEYHTLSGEGILYRSKREAIDAAMAAAPSPAEP